MRKNYKTPDMEVIRFQTEDVITTSGLSGDPDELEPDLAAAQEALDRKALGLKP